MNVVSFVCPDTMSGKASLLRERGRAGGVSQLGRFDATRKCVILIALLVFPGDFFAAEPPESKRPSSPSDSAMFVTEHVDPHVNFVLLLDPKRLRLDFLPDEFRTDPPLTSLSALFAGAIDRMLLVSTIWVSPTGTLKTESWLTAALPDRAETDEPALRVALMDLGRLLSEAPETGRNRADYVVGPTGTCAFLTDETQWQPDRTRPWREAISATPAAPCQFVWMFREADREREIQDLAKWLAEPLGVPSDELAQVAVALRWLTVSFEPDGPAAALTVAVAWREDADAARETLSGWTKTASTSVREEFPDMVPLLDHIETVHAAERTTWRVGLNDDRLERLAGMIPIIVSLVAAERAVVPDPGPPVDPDDVPLIESR